MSENEEKKVGRSRLPYLLLNITLVLIILFLIGKYFVQEVHLFGEELVLSDEQIPTITLASSPTDTPGTTLSPESTPTITTTSAPPAPTLEPICNAEKPVEYFLFIAKDYEENNDNFVSPEDYTVGFADAIRIVRVDFRDGSISMLSIPRDLMVAVPNLESEGLYQARLKIVYSYGYEYDVQGGGASLLAQALSSNFGFEIDHYVILNYWAFVLGIESIGGISIDIPSQAGYYSPGYRHLNGWQALDYARLRDSAGEDNSDAARRERQTQVLFAIQETAFSKEILPKLPQVTSHLLKAVRTDLTNEQISQYLCLAENVNSVDSQDLSPEFYTQELDAYGKELLSPDYIAIREFVAEFQQP